jgi:hypothetical protein
VVRKEKIIIRVRKKRKKEKKKKRKNPTGVEQQAQVLDLICASYSHLVPLISDEEEFGQKDKCVVLEHTFSIRKKKEIKKERILNLNNNKVK